MYFPLFDLLDPRI